MNTAGPLQKLVLRLTVLSLSLPLLGCAEMTASSTSSRQAGQKMYAEGNYTDAAGAFRNAVRKDPTDYKSWYHLGQTYEAQKNWHQAIQAYQAALDVQKRTMPGREDEAMRVKIIDALAQAIARGNDGTFQDDAMAHRPRTAENKYVEAKAYAYMGDVDSAIEAFNQAVLLDKKDFAIAKDYGLFLEKLPGMRNDAAKQLKRAYQMKPKDEQVVAALRRVGVVPGPSLKEQEQLAQPALPKGPLPEVDIKRWREQNAARSAQGTASTAEQGATSGPRD